MEIDAKPDGVKKTIDFSLVNFYRSALAWIGRTSIAFAGVNSVGGRSTNDDGHDTTDDDGRRPCTNTARRAHMRKINRINTRRARDRGTEQTARNKNRSDIASKDFFNNGNRIR